MYQFRNRAGLLRSGATLGLVAMLLVPITVLGAAPVPQDTVADIPPQREVVITATRSPYSVEQVANTVRVINRDAIVRSRATNVAELLRNYGAVQVRDSMGNGRDARLTLRGYGAAANALVLVDGRKLNNSDLSGQDLTAVSATDIARVEILEGGAGALFGDKAVGGVINIITTGHQDDVGRISISRGSYDNDQYSAAYSHRLNSGWYYGLSTRVERSDGYRDGSVTNYENYSGRLGYRYRRGDVFVDTRQSDNEYRLTGALGAAQVGQNRRQAGSSFNDYAADNRTVRLGIDYHFTDAAHFLATYSDRDEDVLIGAVSGFGNSLSRQNRRVKSLDPRLIIATDNWRLTLGVDIEQFDYGFAVDFGFGASASAHEKRKRSEYVQLFYAMTDRLNLQSSVRHARLKTAVKPFGIDYDQSATAHQLGAVWRGAGWRVYLNRDETFRFPLADENVDFFGVVNLLEVQRGVAWELGADNSWRDVDASLAIYQQENRDEIGFDPALGFFGANTNFDDTRRRGATLEVNWAATKQWSASALYTYVDARFTAGTYADKRIPNVAQQLAKLNVNYRPQSALNLAIEWVYTGPQTLDLANSAGRVGGYTVANAVAHYQLQKWTLALRLNNIAAKEYTELVTFFGTRASYPSPERNLMASLTYEF